MTTLEKAYEIVKQKGDCDGMACDNIDPESRCPCYSICEEFILDMSIDDLEKLCLDKAKQFIADNIRVNNQDSTFGSWIDGWGEGINGPRAAFTIWIDNPKTQEYKIVSGSNKELICIIPSGKHSEGNEDSISALISAAPDMYKALEKAVEEYGKSGGPWNVPFEPGSWIALAKAALAKARGE